MRAFFAIWPAAAARASLAAVAREAVLGIGQGRPVSAENLHVTLAFLGAVESDRLAAAVTAADTVRFASFVLRLDTIRYRSRQRIAWAVPSVTPQPLVDLARDLGRALADAGFRMEARGFNAHLTLARDLPCRTEQTPIDPISIDVAEFALVLSEPARGGSVYRVAHRFGA